MSILARLSDSQYKNWLKCTLALGSLKESLHDYTEAGVRRLHSNVKDNILTLLGSRYQCSACSWKGIQRQRLTGGWSIRCINSICNVWLQEILKKHDDPQIKTINWKNADITKWPTEPWEIAKIYMTKGQWNNANLPQELDSPALLSLIKYCKEFRPVNVQLVSDIIEIRNQVYHSPCMSVSDTDKDTWFEKILLLLSDLNIEGMVLTEMRKLKTKDIDEYFREQELKAHQNRISEVVNEVETLKDNFESLEDTQSVHEVVIHEQSAYGNLHFGALETELNTQSQHKVVVETLSGGGFRQSFAFCSDEDWQMQSEFNERKSELFSNEDWQLETEFKERKSELETIIEIRNQVFHSPCMSVSDTDKDTWFDKMLLLLSDLNIEGMVLTEMRKLKTKDIGEYFREQELKAHQNRISEVVNEVETLKDNFESLEDTQSVHEVVIHEQSAYGNLHFGALETELNTQSQHEAEFLSAGEICSIRITPECRDWQLETAFKERKSELETLKTIDMDECSREQESKAHQNWISEVANEVETLKNNFESLENTQRQLGQESQLRDVAQGKSVVSHFQSATIWTPQGQDRQLETEFKERKSKLETYAQVIATMKAFMDNNPDLSSTKISEELKATSEVIMAMQSRLPTAYSSAGTSKFYSVLSEQERKF